MNKSSIRRRELKAEREQKGLCVYCGKEFPKTGTKGCVTCLENKYKIHKTHLKKDGYVKARAYNFSIRIEVINKYGGRCSCCGESTMAFLTIDHVNDDGASERKQLYGSQNGSSKVWFLKLRREDKREDLQVLCYNCNNAKAVFGKCPHKDKDVLPNLEILSIDRRRNESEKKAN